MRSVPTVFLWLACAAVAAEEVRQWNAGDFTERGEFVSLDKGTVTLRLASGEEVEVDLSALSDTDQSYVRTKTAKQSPFRRKGAGANAVADSQQDSALGTALMQPGAQEKLSRFEAECDEVCAEMLAAYRAFGSSPRDIVVSAGDKLEELGRNPEKRMNGRGISAGCARATMTYLGMCSFISLEAAARCIGQELPDGGMVGMVDSMLSDADRHLKEEGNAEEFWTHMALVRASIRLYANSNTFNADFERQLIEGGAQPVVIDEMRRLRKEISSLLMAQYSTSIKYALEQYGTPPFSER